MFALSISRRFALMVAVTLVCAQAEAPVGRSPVSTLGANAGPATGSMPVPHAPMVVLSDTPSYCDQLSGDLSAAFVTTPPTPEVRALVENGQVLCHRGEIRAGIARLRRAMLFLRNESHLPP
jgi:hypothetical protein